MVVDIVVVGSRVRGRKGTRTRHWRWGKEEARVDEEENYDNGEEDGWQKEQQPLSRVWNVERSKGRAGKEEDLVGKRIDR